MGEIRMVISRTAISLLMYSGVLIQISCVGDETVRSISSENVKAKIDGKEEIVLLDVRTLEEYYSSSGHLPGAILIPHDEIENRISELVEMKTKEIIVYCRSGRRSSIATNILAKNGFNAVNMDGGILRWNSLYGDK